MFFNTKSFGYEDFMLQNRGENEHDPFSERLRKTWYYGKLPGTERPSLAVTDLLVDFYNEAAPRELGKLDSYVAASTARSACISPSSVMAGVMYVKRLKKRRPDYLTQVSSSELFLISMMMASKFLYDEGVDEEVFNDEWAASGDLETEDVNKLELDFLSAMDWQLFVGQEEFAEMLNKIEKRIAFQRGTERGWFTYTDLMVLSNGLQVKNWKDLVAELSTVFSVSSLAYIAGVLTLVGSTMLGTATSTAVMKAGTRVLPLGYSLLPIMTLNSDLQSEFTLSRSVLSFDGVEVSRQAATSNQSQGREQKQENLHFLQETFRSNSNGNQEQTGDDLNTETLKKSHTKEQTGLLNGFLSPFFALLTLKDTFFQFAFGASKMLIEDDGPFNPSDLEDADVTLTSDSGKQEFCSSGPCQVDSWLECWNISEGNPWSTFKQQEQRSKGRLEEPAKRGLDYVEGNYRCQGCCHSNSGAGQGHCVESPGVHARTYCCCRLRTSEPRLPKSLYHQAIMDINLRFATRSVVPIFVTT